MENEIARIKGKLSDTKAVIKDGKTMVEVSLTDINQLLEIAYLAERAKHIMSFHTLRCPMNIINNFSSMEEHLAEYRAVIRELEKKL